jgi:hypothetical protein
MYTHTTPGVVANPRHARASGEHDRHVAKVKSDPNLRRIVYLHD